MSNEENDDKIVVNKYGRKVHDIGLPWYNTYEDTRMCINPDIDHVIETIKKIHDSNGRCPSKKCYVEYSTIHNTDFLVPDTRCPCPEFLCKGVCECGLFVPQPISPSLIRNTINNEEKENETN